MADLFGTGPQTTSTSTNLGFATPYFDRLMYAAEGEAQRGFTPYGGQRVAQSSPLQNMAFQQASAMGTPQTFGQAANLFATSAQTGQGLSQFTPGRFNPSYSPTAFNSGYNAGQLNQNLYSPSSFDSGYRAGTFTPGYFGPGDSYDNASKYQSGQIASTYRPGTFSQQDFDAAQSQRYMNPYTQGVTDIARREADTAFQKQQNALRLGQAARGAFGGSRATLMETEAQRAQNQLQNDIQTKGLQEAFANAQAQFNADRARRFNIEQAQEQAFQQAGQMGLTAQQANEAARLAGSQLGLSALQAREQARQQAGQMGLSAQQMGEQARQTQGTMSLDAQRLADQSRLQSGQLSLQQFQANEAARQQAGQQSLSAQQQAEQSRQFGANLGLEGFRANEAARQQAANLLLQGNQQAISSATGLAGLGQQMTNSEMARIGQLAELGNQMRGIQQQGLDVNYKDFLEQRDYGRDQLNFLSSILSRVPLGNVQTQTSTTPGPNVLGQLANLGLSGAAIYNMINRTQSPTGGTQ